MSEQINEDVNPFVGSSDDLESFKDELFGNSQPPVEEENANEEQPVEDEVEVDEEDSSTDDETGEDDTPAPETKKKSRFQERIDQLSEKARLERERADALEARLKKLEEKDEPKESITPTKTPQGEPTVDDVDENGDPKYPLGEFDPKFAKDMIKYALAEQLREQQEQQAERDKQEAIDSERAAIDAEWNVKVEAAKERYPDFQEKGVGLIETLQEELDPAYGDYLALTIQQLDNGSEVFYHLATNIEEARAIAQMSAAKATLALGRLDALYSSDDETLSTKSVTPKVKTSSAPPPPPRNKGSSASTQVSPDTDDLEAFKAQFFKPSGRRR